MTDILFRSPERLAVPCVATISSGAMAPTHGDNGSFTYHYPHLPAYLPSVWRYPGLAQRPTEGACHLNSKYRTTPESIPLPTPNATTGVLLGIPTESAGRRAEKRSFDAIDKDKDIEWDILDAGFPKRLKQREREGDRRYNHLSAESSSMPESSQVKRYRTAFTRDVSRPKRCKLAASQKLPEVAIKAPGLLDQRRLGWTHAPKVRRYPLYCASHETRSSRWSPPPNRVRCP